MELSSVPSPAERPQPCSQGLSFNLSSANSRWARPTPCEGRPFPLLSSHRTAPQKLFCRSGPAHPGPQDAFLGPKPLETHSEPGTTESWAGLLHGLFRSLACF